MHKILYPAIFHREKGGYWVSFPDIPGCLTDGDTLQEAYDNALDALGLYIEDIKAEDYPVINEKHMPKNLKKNEMLVLVDFDPVVYMRKHSKSVKKTLTIPAWLNAIGEKQKINFSKVLQNALLRELKVSE